MPILPHPHLLSLEDWKNFEGKNRNRFIFTSLWGYSELDRCQEPLDREETLQGSEWASPGVDCARETSEGEEPLERQSWLGCTASRFPITSRLPWAAGQEPSPTCFGGGGIKQPVALHFARSISGHSEGLAENPPRLASFQKSNILAML